jgi:coenzyme F420-reducing hydrogenase delta subunit
MAPAEITSVTRQPNDSARARPAGAAPAVTVYLCANCARPSHAPDCTGLSRLTVPSFEWPIAVQEVLVPCTGRIQPEHVLKEFERGADLVCAISCEEDDCHYLEGSRRCARRVDYLRALLDEVGLGGERVLLFHLPGSANGDTALGAARPAPICAVGPGDARLAAIREEVLRALDGITPNPLYTGPAAVAVEEAYQDVDTSEDDSNE